MAEIIKYEKKRVLVIEDHGEFRSSMRAMLDMFGAQTIDTAASGPAGLEYLRKYKYDIILSDYELGKGADGQQILEETRYTGLIKASSVFVLVTAATTVEMVMGALEFEPDGYITKPITFKDLQTRLNRIMQNKLVFSGIDDALDKKKFDLAIEECDKVISSHPKHALRALRTKGKLLIDKEEYVAAEQVYQSIIDDREIPWASLGVGKCLYLQKRYDEAEVLLKELAEADERFADAFDWLAKVFIAKGNHKKAEEALIDGIKRSPKSILRQKELGNVALKMEDWTIAEKAYRKAVSLGKFSCFKAPETYTSLAKALQIKIQNNKGRLGLDAFNESIRLLDTVEKEYSRRDDVVFESTILRGETYINIGNKDSEVTKCLNKSKSIYDEYPGHVPEALAHLYADHLKHAGFETDAEDVLSNI